MSISQVAIKVLERQVAAMQARQFAPQQFQGRRSAALSARRARTNREAERLNIVSGTISAGCPPSALSEQ
jgi:hypothetical protein